MCAKSATRRTQRLVAPARKCRHNRAADGRYPRRRPHRRSHSLVPIARSAPMSKTEPDASADKIVKSDAAWRSELTAEQYYVLRQHGTERPGASPLNREKRNGMFQCAGCGAALFASGAKFESGTGWPSFDRPAGPRTVSEHEDRLPVHAAHRGALRPLRRPPRPCLPRRPAGDHGPALLHQWRRTQVQPGGGLTLDRQPSDGRPPLRSRAQRARPNASRGVSRARIPDLGRLDPPRSTRNTAQQGRPQHARS